MALVAVLYSVTAELSLVSLLRGTSIAERSHTETTSENLKSRRKDLLSEKASLPSVRPQGIVAAEIDGLEATPGLKTCDPKSEDYGRASRKVCPKLSALKTELATATRLAEIDKEVSEIDTKLSASGPVLAADPGAASIVAYGKLLGFTLDVKAISELLTLIPVLALELGSALALVLVRAVTPTRNAPEQAFPVVSPIEGGTLEGLHGVVTEQGPEARLLEYLRANGGTVETGQRTLAKAVGLSTTRLNGLLKSMAEVGRLKARHVVRGNGAHAGLTGLHQGNTAEVFGAHPPEDLVARNVQMKALPKSDRQSTAHSQDASFITGGGPGPKLTEKSPRLSLLKSTSLG